MYVLTKNYILFVVRCFEIEKTNYRSRIFVVCSPMRFTWDFMCSCFRRNVQGGFFRFSEGRNGKSSSGRTAPRRSAPHQSRLGLLASPRRAPLRPNSPRPARPRPVPTAVSLRGPPPVGCPGFGIDR